MKSKFLAAFAALALLAGGCVTSQAVSAKDPLVAYYASLADYNGAKRIALAYVELPSTTKREANVVVSAVQRGDDAVAQVESLRASCEAAAETEANESVPNVCDELTAAETANLFAAAKSVAFAACLPTSKLEATGRVLQVIAAELRARALAKGE